MSRHLAGKLWSRRDALAAAAFVLAALPLAASADCGGKLASLQSYAGKYRYQDDLLKAPAVAAKLQPLPGDDPAPEAQP